MNKTQVMLLFRSEAGTTSRTALRLRVVRMGADLCLLLDGGDRPHIGAVAVAYAEGIEPACLSLPRHREDELARRIAQRVHETLQVTVTVLCGIHIENITKAEIAAVLAEAEALTTDFLNTATHKDRPC